MHRVKHKAGPLNVDAVRLMEYKAQVLNRVYAVAALILTPLAIGAEFPSVQPVPVIVSQELKAPGVHEGEVSKVPEAHAVPPSESEIPNQSKTITALSGVYAQSERFWKTVDSLKENPDYLSTVNRYFSDRGHQIQEAWSSVGLGLSTASFNPFHESFEQGSFGMGMEALAGGQIRNRISPRIEAYQIYHAYFSFDIDRGSWIGSDVFRERYYTPGFGLLLGTRAGVGRQHLLAGEVSGFLGKTLEKKYFVYEGSFSSGLSYNFFINESLRSYTAIRFDPSFFHASSVDEQFGDAVQPRTDTYRWRVDSENIFHFSERGGLGVGALFITGPQPYPFDVLPRIWDPVHEDLIEFDIKAQYFGVGPVLELASSTRRYAARLLGGFYGGYWGAGVEMRLAFFNLQAGSFGIEMSPRYRSFENRIFFAKGGLQLEW